MKDIRTVVEDFGIRYHGAMEHPDGVSGFASGFCALDRVTSGWKPGELIVMADRPKMGMRQFVLSMFCKMLDHSSRGILWFSLQWSAHQWIDRFAAMVCEVHPAVVVGGRLSEIDRRVKERYLDRLADFPLSIDDSSFQTVETIRRSTLEWIRKNDKQPDLLIIDNLELLHLSNEPFADRTTELKEILRALKALAKECDTAVMVLAQHSDAPDFRADDTDGKCPLMSDLQERMPVNDDVDVVCLLYRPEFYKLMEYPDGTSTLGHVELNVEKNNGDTGIVYFFISEKGMRYHCADNVRI
jgi:replicative DNA helicase